MPPSSFAAVVIEGTEKISQLLARMDGKDPFEDAVNKGRIAQLLLQINEKADARIDRNRAEQLRWKARADIANIPVPLPRGES